MILPLSQLKGACEKQVAIVRKLYPDGIPLTLAAARKLITAGVDIFWAERLLSGEAWEAYEAAKAPAWEAYETATAKAWEAYLTARAPAWKTYEAATAKALVKALRAQEAQA